MRALLFTAALFLVQLLHFSAVAIPLSDFYPFGAGNGDEVFSNDDDNGSRLFILSDTFPFYGVDHSTLDVSLSMLYMYNYMSCVVQLLLNNSPPIMLYRSTHALLHM